MNMVFKFIYETKLNQCHHAQLHGYYNILAHNSSRSSIGRTDSAMQVNSF